MPRLDGTHVRVGRVFAIVVAGAALQIVTQTVLARSLSKPDVGLISLILGAVPLLSTLAILGQDAAIVRFAASAGTSYDGLASRGAAEDGPADENESIREQLKSLGYID